MNDPRLTIGLLIIVLGFLIILMVILMMLRRRHGPVENVSGQLGKGRRKNKNAGGFERERVKPCPICGTMLKKGERVKSVVYPGKPDRMTHIFGCQYCYPLSPGAPRICPVCKKVIAEDGYVVARMFEGKGKKHVHVLGCTGCRRVR